MEPFTCFMVRKYLWIAKSFSGFLVKILSVICSGNLTLRDSFGRHRSILNNCIQYNIVKCTTQKSANKSEFMCLIRNWRHGDCVQNESILVSQSFRSGIRFQIVANRYIMMIVNFDAVFIFANCAYALVSILCYVLYALNAFYFMVSIRFFFDSSSCRMSTAHDATLMIYTAMMMITKSKSR